MKVEQIYSLANSALAEAIGESAVLNEDLTNVVDMGKAVFDNEAVDKYVKSLINHIGKVVFVDRPYRGVAPSVLMDSWEFGSVLEKIQMELPTATENETWELEDGTSYDPNIFYKPVVSAKFFNSKTTFEIPISITEEQVKQSFSNAEQLNGFISMIYNAVEKALSKMLDELIMRTINNMIGETLYDEFSTGAYGNNSGIRAINLLYEYNNNVLDPTAQGYVALTSAKALHEPAFLRYATEKMGLVKDRMRGLSTLFNVGGKTRQTPEDLLHTVFLTDFVKACESNLYSDTFHEEYVKAPNAETVPCWQGTGTDFAFNSVSKIYLKTSANHSIQATGILGVMFDRDALGVTNLNKRTTTNYNAKAEFTNYFFKTDAGYFNDLDENFVVFYIADYVS